MLSSSHIISFIFVLCILFCGYTMLYHQVYPSPRTVKLQDCSSTPKSLSLKRSCLAETIHTLTPTEIVPNLSAMVPQELANPSALDWQAITLFPFIEYRLAQHCVFDSDPLPYCDQAQRLAYHRQMDKQLMSMLNSKNEDIQHRALILACQRNHLHTLSEYKPNALKARALMLFVSTCGDTSAQRLMRIEQTLKQSPELLDMALILLYAQDSPGIPQYVQSLEATHTLSDFARALITVNPQGAQE